MEVENKFITIKGYVDGKASESDFEVRSAPFELKVEEGSNDVVVKNLCVSIDPYQMNRMREYSSSQTAINFSSRLVPGGTVDAHGIGIVVASAHQGFEKDDTVVGLLGWEEYSLVKGGAWLRKIESKEFPLSYHLGILGLSGLTAYAGFYNICKPKKGEKVFVSAASGSVGNIVGQLAKLFGCYVVGCAGSKKKVDLLKDKLGFDDAFNYKEEPDLKSSLKSIQFKAGRGDRIKFWSDTWCGSSPLAVQFPSIFCLAINPLGTTSQFFSVTGNQVVWDIPLRRNLHDPVTDAYSDLLHTLVSFRINTSVEDSLFWWPDKSGNFSVKSFYSWSTSVSDTASVNPKIWSSYAPPRAISFVWTAALGKILTQDNLRRRGRIIVSACPLCLHASEESNHLLLHCSFVTSVWHLVLAQFGVSWVMASSIADLSFAWDIVSVSPRCASLWDLSFFATV